MASFCGDDNIRSREYKVEQWIRMLSMERKQWDALGCYDVSCDYFKVYFFIWSQGQRCFGFPFLYLKKPFEYKVLRLLDSWSDWAAHYFKNCTAYMISTFFSLNSNINSDINPDDHSLCNEIRAITILQIVLIVLRNLTMFI